MRSSAKAALAIVLVAGLSVPARAQLFGSDQDRAAYGNGQAPAAAAANVAPPPAPVAAPPAPDDQKKQAPAPAPAGVAPGAVKVAEKSAADRRKEEADELAKAVKQFDDEALEYAGDVQLVIQRRFQEEKDRITGQFDKGIRSLETSERKERLDAIALFERFLARYPDDEKYTPDAMTRLAELYYEKSVDDADEALTEYEERAKLGTDEQPPSSQRSFRKSIALYQQIITRFPGYRLIDSIYYLLGWCLSEQGDSAEGRDTFRALIDKYPKSKYVAEAWVRIGEYYFDDDSPGDPNEKLRMAADAYTHALAFEDSPLYDKALYKLGWSYYRLNDFDHGVDAFVKLIDYYDAQKKKNPEAGGGDLRAEALQYTAISFADDTWGGTATNPDGTQRFLGVQKMVDYFKRIGPRPYEYELFKKLGDVLFDSTKYAAAIEAYRIVLERNPTAPDAPKTQERIVQAFARAGDKDSAFAERQKLVDNYGRNGAWAKANSGDHDVLEAASDLVEKSLLATAQYHHQQAAEYDKEAADPNTPPDKKAQLTALAFQEYQKAAKGYGDYLKAFPHSKNVYEIEYYHADTLYRSLQFLEAAQEYARVRDSNDDDKYLADSAYDVVLSYQREIEKEETQGLLEKRDPCDAEKCKTVTDFKPLPIPDIRLKLIQAADTYMQRIPTAKDAALLSYKAAQTYFTYFHFDDARARYEAVIKRFPDSDVAGYSYDDILTTYLLLKDWTKVEEFAGRMLKESKSVQNDPKKFENVRLLKYGARFERANLAMQQKKWDEAAKLYLSIVDDTEAELASGKAKDHWSEADKALFNAATCFKEQRKFDSAMRTYERLYKDYSGSELAEKSLFYVAENAEKAFDFDKAIDDYMLLFRRYTDDKNKEDRVAALFNAAKLLESMQRYKEAADAYKLYATKFHDQPDAPDMQYQGVVMYQRMHDLPGMIERLTGFIHAYDHDEKQAEKVVQAYEKIGKAWHDLGDDRKALKAYEECVSEYDKKKMTPQNYLAASAASEAKFQLDEQDYAVFAKMKFDPKGRGPKLQKAMKSQLEGLAKKMADVQKEYTEVIVKYQWPEWMMASLYRIGNSYEEFANKLINAPCPAEVKALGGDEACAEYAAQIGDLVAPILDKASNAYITAQNKAKDLRISDEWTKLTSEKVCQVSPSECISLKDPRAKLIIDDLSARPLAADAAGDKFVVYKTNAAAQAPVVTDVQPRKAKAGDTLTVTGQNFNGDAATIVLKIADKELHIDSADKTKLVAKLPPDAKGGTVTVTTTNGTYTTTFQVDVGLAAPAGIGSPAAVLAPAVPGAVVAPAPAKPASAAPAPAPAPAPIVAPAPVPAKAGGAP